MNKLADLLKWMMKPLSDKQFLYIDFLRARHRFLHLQNPVTFSEKIQWTKLYGNLQNNYIYVDKYLVREHVAGAIGEQYLVPLIGTWASFDEIPFEQLPGKFVLKATHGSGHNFICKDKNKLNKEELRAAVGRWLSEDFSAKHREVQYTQCQPRLICEEYIESTPGEELKNYEFYCTNGVPRIIEVNSGDGAMHRSNVFDAQWNKVPVKFGYPEHEHKIPKPTNLDEMLRLSRMLSKQFPFVRVDFYSINEKIFFGELTFTPGAGIGNLFKPREADLMFGSLIDLSAYNLEKNQRSNV